VTGAEKPVRKRGDLGVQSAQADFVLLLPRIHSPGQRAANFA
jgi:hypothetical protein